MLPHLLGEEAVAHQVAGLHHELLALVPFLVAELRVVIGESQPAEGHVARLVLHDIGVYRGRQRIAGAIADQLEGGQREPLDQDLHAQVGHVPARVAQDLVEERAQRRIDRIGQLELLVEQAGVGLDVPRLVHDLGRRVVLGVHLGHLLHDLGGADQRALLAVQELRELPRLVVAAHLRFLLLRQLREAVPAEDRNRLIGEAFGILGVEILGPVDSLLRVPLQLLALAVESEQVGAAVVVLPAESRLELRGHLPARIGGHLVAIEGRHVGLPVRGFASAKLDGSLHGISVSEARCRRSRRCARRSP